MKKIILMMITGLMLSLTAFSQNYTVTVYGNVMLVDGNTVTPVADQEVLISIDSTGSGFTYLNGVYTDQNGYYEDVITIPGFNGYMYVQTMTYDPCLGGYQYNGQVILPGVTLPAMDFYLCENTPPPCQASFYYYQLDPVDLLTFAFVNQSIGNYTITEWSFGDSTFSMEANPIHRFPGEGTYYVCLTISDGNGCTSTYCDYVYAGGGATGCENYFIYTPGIDTFSINFEGFLYNGQTAQSYWWDFGDGTAGQGQAVSHTFNIPPGSNGMFMVGLTTVVMDSLGVDSCFYTSYQEVWVQNGPPPSGCESFILIQNINDLTVDFEGYTVSPLETQYNWDFGDGTLGTGQFISHTFPYPGMYNVLLNTIDADGCAYQTITQVWLDSTYYPECNNYFTYVQDDSLTYTFTGFVYFNNGMTWPEESEYLWDFGDGTTGTGQIITHTFQDYPPSGFSVCLTTVSALPDSTSCTATYCENISFVIPSFYIFGGVYLDNNIMADQGVVHLMMLDSLMQGVMEVQTTTIDSAGWYSFSEVPMNNQYLYFVQAELTEQSAYFGQYLPTYHQSALVWEQAVPVLPLMNWPADIQMIPATMMGSGSGSITGLVTSLGARGAMNDVEVVLLDSNGNPLTYLRSDQDGRFTFEGLPFGSYIVHAEMAGIHTVHSQVTLSEDQQSVDVQVQVDGGEANTVFSSVSEFMTVENAGEIYPNPVNNNSAIEITMKKPALLNISIYSQTGQLMKAESLSLDNGTFTLRIDAGDFPPGFYLYRITSGQGDEMTRKFLKVK